MTISDNALTLVNGALSAAGFAVSGVFAQPESAAGDTAVVSVEKTALSELDSVSGSCRAEVTVKARLYAAERGFFGAERFSALCEQLQTGLYFGSELLISRAELSGLTKDMQLGRLARTLTVTAVYDIEEEEET